MSVDIQTIVIGAGVVGLAAARQMALCGREVMVLEQHGLIGSETSARNSEVIHAGIYYPKDSLKARCCVHGKHLLYQFCAERGVGHERLGKLVVATDDAQLDDLEGIRAKAFANGVEDLRLLSKADVRELEPALSVKAALLSPSTGIVDSHGLMLALQGELEAQGGQVVLNTPVTAIAPLASGGFSVSVSSDGGYEISCQELILSAGHGAAVLAKGLIGDQSPQTFWAKGSYFKLAGKAPFSRLIYPVPIPGGAGVHLTLDLQHQARFGPDVEWVEEFEYQVDPARGESFYATVRQYWPDLQDGALVPDYSGIRPKISPPGAPTADFRIDGPQTHGIAGFVGLYGIESPGLTACLSIAEEVAARLA